MPAAWLIVPSIDLRWAAPRGGGGGAAAAAAARGARARARGRGGGLAATRSSVRP